MYLILVAVGGGLIGALNGHYNIPAGWGVIHALLWTVTIMAIRQKEYPNREERG